MMTITGQPRLLLSYPFFGMVTRGLPRYLVIGIRHCTEDSTWTVTIVNTVVDFEALIHQFRVLQHRAT